MADLDDYEALDSPPPPAYEVSEQEFDQKVAHALEASQNDQQQQRSDNGEDDWEVWDEAIFSIAAAQLSIADAPNVSSSNDHEESGSNPVPTLGEGSSTVGASSTGDIPRSPEVRPLCVMKKSVKKERPRWYAEAQLDGDEARSTAVAPESSSITVPDVVAPSGRSTPRADRIPSRDPTPPPEFTETGPDLDGPPYEPYECSHPEVTLTWAPGHSNPPSRLASPTIPPGRDLFSHEAPLTTQPTHSRSPFRAPAPSVSPSPAVPSSTFTTDTRSQLAAVPLSQSTYQIRPSVSLSNLKPKYGAPRIAFDPQIAYASERPTHHHRAESSTTVSQIDAAAFYNSSVSALYTAGRGFTTRYPAQNISTGFSQLPSSQLALLAPQPRVPLLESLSTYGTGRASPTPSVQSMQSARNSEYPSDRSSTYQSVNPVPGSQQTNAYHPISYQPASYQSTSNQTTSYQPTSYQPTSYQQTPRRW